MLKAFTATVVQLLHLLVDEVDFNETNSFTTIIEIFTNSPHSHPSVGHECFALKLYMVLRHNFIKLLFNL